MLDKESKTINYALYEAYWSYLTKHHLLDT
jgi:hypothetical protein